MEENKKNNHSTTLIIGFLTSAISLFIFAMIAEDILENEVFKFDVYITNWIQSFEGLGSLMFWITESGSLTSTVVFSLLTIYYLYKKKNDSISAYFFIFTIIGGGLLNYLLKVAFHRVRPSINDFIDAVGFSFPSGHAMGSMIFYGIISYFIIKSSRSKLTKSFLILISFIFINMIGISRIYLNAHYPSDVIAGYLAGFSWLSFCIFSMNRYKKNHKNIRVN